MRLTGIIERGKAVAALMRQGSKEQEFEKKRSTILVQILIVLSLATLGIILGYFFPLPKK